MKLKIGILFFTILTSFAILTPFFSDYTYYEIDLAKKNQPPNKEHWLGTDDLGRDILTRTAYGARISLFVGLAAAVIDLIIGVVWGGVAALAGGVVDKAMMTIADILYALPYLLVVILILIVAGPGLLSIILAMAVIGWITMARIIRGHILQLRQQEFVLASRALGAGFWRILFHHLIPNSAGQILVTLTLTIPSAIFTEAFLSFLGLGVQAPIASWGTMANEGLPALQFYPWRLFAPTACICFTIYTFYLLGEGLRDHYQEQEVSHVPAA